MDSIDEFVSKISSVSYDGRLKVVRVVKSINCKEWEKEKEQYRLSGVMFSSMAHRCYVTQKLGNSHMHEGHIDFRPIIKSDKDKSDEKFTISDAFLPVPENPNENYYVTCKKAFRSDDPVFPIIETVPYTRPDNIHFLCSPSTLWIVLRTASIDFGKEYISLSDINNSLHPSSIGNSVGITEYIPFFSKYGYEPVFYSGNSKVNFFKNCRKEIKGSTQNPSHLKSLYNLMRGDGGKLKNSVMNSDILYSYIESGIPVYMVFEAKALFKELNYKAETTDRYHAVVAIGHTLDGKYNCTHYIIHDVSYAPFVKISKTFVNKNLLEALVLLPVDIKQRAENIRKALKKVYSLYSSYDERFLNPRKYLKIRPFLRRSQDIKFWFTNPNLYDDRTVEMFQNADFPTYIWVIEIKPKDISDLNRCMGHIIFDATLSEEGLLLVNLPRFRLWFENKKVKGESFIKYSFVSLPIFKTPVKSESTQNN